MMEKYLIVRMEKSRVDMLTTISRVYLRLCDGSEFEITEILQSIDMHHDANNLATLAIVTPHFRVESVER